MLTVNVAAALASLGKRVLLVDSDPQCNLTAYLVAEDVVNNLLDTSDSDQGRTIWTAVKPVYHATGPLRTVEPYETAGGLFLIPGDIRLSEFELALADYWTECFKRRLGGFKAVTAISCLVNEVAKARRIDYVFYDTGPNIGPLNRVILLDSDYFVVPVACDLFSVRALSTLGQTLRSWIRDWQTIVELAPDEAELLPGRPRFLGYIPQRFKIYGGAMARAYSAYLSQVEKHVFSDVVSVLSKRSGLSSARTMPGTRLGEVKDFGTLVQLSQTQGVPLAEVDGGDAGQKMQARNAFARIAKRIVERTQNARSRAESKA